MSSLWSIIQPPLNDIYYRYTNNYHSSYSSEQVVYTVPVNR